MQKIDGRKLQFIIPNDLDRELKKIADRHDTTESQIIRNLLYFGVDVYRDFEAIGMVKFVEIISRAKKAIRKNAGQQKLFDS